MPTARFVFPEDFLWGTATASHQVEGQNNNNDWSAWEQEEGRIVQGQVCGRACDWWGGRWKEDFNRAASTGQNAHRMSIEWSRVQPETDRWDEAALDRYREMLKGLHERDLQAMVTLHHFTTPLWLVQMGGWENEAVVPLFGAYVKRTVEALSPYCKLWVTVNEPNVYMSGGWLGGGFPPGKGDLKLAIKVLTNMVKAHAEAYRVIHELQSDAQVGVAHHWREFIPGNKGPMTAWLTRTYNKAFNDAFAESLRTGLFDAVFHKESIPQAKGTQDFMGLNYYTREYLKFNLFKKSQIFSDRYYPKDAELSENGFLANDPAGFRKGIKWAHSFGLPIYITEQGVEDSTGLFRSKNLIEHLHAMWMEINESVPVKGYFHWSLVDNFEWERAWTQRFGLWGLDLESQKRIRRPGVDLYEEICKNNELSAETIAKYVPGELARIFPE